MLKIAITGNIGSGKSTVSKIFRDMGIHTVSCDDLVRQFHSPGNVLWMNVKKEWGGRYIGHDQRIDRKKLARDLLESREFREKLEDISHPVVKEEMIKIFNKWKSEGSKMVAAEVPLLYEAGWEYMFDKVVLTVVSRQQQIKRIVETRSIDVRLAEKWINVQRNRREKEGKSDIVVNMDKDIEEIRVILKKFIESLKEADQ
ncbi:dephospho-CoA kinase [Elusimicrobiota bacterium]